MDPIPFVFGATIATGLVAAVTALWGKVSESNKRCEQGRADDQKAINELRALITARSDAEVTKAEERERRAEDREEAARNRALEIARILDDTKELTRMAVRDLRRIRSGKPIDLDTPIPGESGALVAKREGETSEFYQESKVGGR